MKTKTITHIHGNLDAHVDIRVLEVDPTRRRVRVAVRGDQTGSRWIPEGDDIRVDLHYDIAPE